MIKPFLILFLALSPLAASAQTADPLQQISHSVQSLTARISPAVVEILVSGYGPPDSEDAAPASSSIGRQSSLGSGVIVDPDGFIVTNYHVIKGARRVSVLVTLPSHGSQVLAALQPEPRSFPAKILGFSRAADLAVLKIEASALPTIPFARYAQLHQGQLVFAFGSPEGLQNSVTMGLVSAVLRQITPDNPMVYIQTDAAINPGNSGGALVDAEGNLVGINTSILTQSGGNEGLGFAIPSGIVRFVYEQIRAHGKVRRPDIGADVESVTPALADALHLSATSGVLVADVDPEGPSGPAGLKIGDVIRAINGMPVASASAFTMSMYMLTIGEKAKVDILRASQKLTLTIPIEEGRQEAGSLTDLADPKTGTVEELGIVGVNLKDAIQLLPEPRINSGVVVAGAVDGDRAGEIGLVAGDIIHQVNTTPVDGMLSLREALGHLKSGSPAALQVERNGQLLFLSFEIE